MFAGKTVVVLGAGSSVDFDMPLGSALLSRIASMAEYEPSDRSVTAIVDTYHKLASGAVAYADACDRIRGAARGYQSIDDLLDRWRKEEDIVLLGKILIAHIILEHEFQSPVRDLWGPSWKDKADEWAGNTWVRELVSIAIAGFRSDDPSELFSDVTLVNFNYDRCAESVIFSLLRRYAFTTDADAARAMAGLKVYRPYGSLGPVSST